MGEYEVGDAVLYGDHSAVVTDVLEGDWYVISLDGIIIHVQGEQLSIDDSYL